MILTTSKRPSGRTRTFVRELSSVVPNAVYVPRGKKGIESLAEDSSYRGHGRLCIILTRNGNPAGFEILDTETHDYIGAIDFSVTLRREMTEKKVRLPLQDEEFFLVSEQEEAPLLAELLDMPLARDAGDAYWYARFEGGMLDFYRWDIGTEPVGPRLFVRGVYGKDYYSRKD